MRPGEYDYEVQGGDCLPVVVKLKDENDAELDLSGYSSELVLEWTGGELRLSNGDRLEMYESSESPVSTSAGSGVISGTITGAETADLPKGRLTKFRWSITAPSGCKTTFLSGYIVRL